MAGTKGNGKIQQKVKAGKNNGGAPCEKNEEENNSIPDLTLLRKSIQTSVTGFAQARSVFDTGTEELKQILSHECDVIYECRVCRNLFRSLANFISHKRIYCREKFNTSLHAHFIDSKFLKNDMSQILQNELDYQAYLKNKDKELSCTIDDTDIVVRKKKKTVTKDLTEIIEKLAQKKSNTHLSENSKNIGSHIKFQNIENTECAVYQNIFTEQNPETKTNKDFIKEQVTELENMHLSKEAILGPDGKLINHNSNTIESSPSPEKQEEPQPKSSLICDICNITFATQKTLKCHNKNKHADNRIVYPCSDCSDTFSNVWSVYRHLYKVHRKNTAHIRKLRDSIQKKAYKQDNFAQETSKDTSTENAAISEQLRMDQENQAWMDNFEGDCEMPRCGGCGRKFERRAALISHRQTCQLRIAAQNKINSNMQRKTVPKPNNKQSSPEIEEPTTTQNIPKSYLKPSEKKIEIKIRRDYNKVPIVSNTNVVERTTITDFSNNASSLQKCVQKSELSNDRKEIAVSLNTCIKTDSSDNTETAEGCDDTEEINLSNINSDAEMENLPESPKSVANESTENEANSSNIEEKLSDSEDAQKNSENLEDYENTDTKMEFLVDFQCDDSATTEELPTEVNLPVSDLVKTENENENVKETNSDSLDNLVCQDCNLDFTSLLLHRKHMMRHYNWKRFKCKLCNFRSYNRSECITHIRNQHEVNNDMKEIDSLVEALPPSQVRSKLTYVSEFIKSQEKSPSKNPASSSKSTEDQKSKPNLILKLKVVDKNKKIVRKTAKTKIKNIKSTSKNKLKKIASKSKSIKKSTAESDKSQCFEIVSETVEEPIKENVEEKLDVCENIITHQDQSVDSITSLEAESSFITSPSPSKESNKKKDSSKTKVIGLKKYNKRITSLKSSTIERPIRNRVKLVNKDFEYDLSNLLKPKIDFHEKESIVSTIQPQKQVKRNVKLLQNDLQETETPLPSQKEHQNKKSSPSKGNRVVTPEKLSIEKLKTTVNQKLSVHKEVQPSIKQALLTHSPGFLVAMSSRASLQGKAHMRNLHLQSPIQGKLHEKSHTKKTKSAQKDVNSIDSLILVKGVAPVVKVNLSRLAPTTHSKILQKYSSDEILKTSETEENIPHNNDDDEKMKYAVKRKNSDASSVKVKKNLKKSTEVLDHSDTESDSEKTNQDNLSTCSDYQDLNQSIDSSNSDNDFKFFISKNQKTYSKSSDTLNRHSHPESKFGVTYKRRVLRQNSDEETASQELNETMESLSDLEMSILNDEQSCK